MSDSNNTDARKHRADGSRFAPRRHRVPPDEAAIMPMLERLSRGESDHASRARKPESVPPAEPIRAPRHAPLAGSRLPLSATGRIAVVLGLVMTVTAVSAALLKSNAQHPATTDTAKALKASSDKQAEAKIQAKNQVKDQAKVQSTDMPRTVHTVAIRPQAATAAPIVGTKPASPAGNGADAAGRAEDLGHVSRSAGGASAGIHDGRGLQDGKRQNIRTNQDIRARQRGREKAGARASQGEGETNRAPSQASTSRPASQRAHRREAAAGATGASRPADCGGADQENADPGRHRCDVRW